MSDESSDGSVWAVVVTYNRKETLGICLQALLKQTRKVDKILVVDNASTDGTAEWLAAKGYLSNPDFIYLRLTENLGGAGGFHEGFKRAFNEGADWLWVMDDDGYPDEEALEFLLSKDAGPFRGPLVLASDDPTGQILAFPNDVAVNHQPTFVHTKTQAEELAVDNLLPGYICPFNGILIAADLVRRIGFPNPGFFIWGDEWDFVYRVREVGVTTTTVTTALFWHPANRAQFEKITLGPLCWYLPVADTEFRNYLLIRNHAYIARRHRGTLSWLRHTLKYLVYLSLNPAPVSPFRALLYSLEGFRGKLTGHRRFLQQTK